MPLVPAICTQCGAQIEVDNTHEAGICKYCGTAFITEKAINNYSTYITNNNNFAGANINIIGGDVANLIELAKNALEIANEQDALKYSEKALEINVKCSEAWFVKMQAERIRACKASVTIEDARSIEAISVAGNNAIKYSDENSILKVTKDVHAYYLEASKALMQGMKVNVEYENVNVLQALAKTNKNAALAKDQMYLLGLTTKELFTLKLLEDISQEEFDNNPEFQQELIDIINLYVTFRNRYKERTLIYSGGPNVEAVTQLKKKYDELINKIPVSRHNEVSKWTLVGSTESTSNNTSTSSGGCYIATCVYGSYDCPEVWTLRRFRDYTLDETWYGRLFIKCYYATSPTLVKWFGNQNWFRAFWKNHLDNMVSKLNQHGVEDTKYFDKY